MTNEDIFKMMFSYHLWPCEPPGPNWLRGWWAQDLVHHAGGQRGSRGPPQADGPALSSPPHALRVHEGRDEDQQGHLNSVLGEPSFTGAINAQHLSTARHRTVC